MRKRTKLREKAIALRQKGKSYNEIRKIVPVSKSSLSLWLKNIRLLKQHRERLYTKQIQILSRGTPSQKARRKQEIEKIIISAKSEVTHPISNDSFLLFGAGLYWAEGSKTKAFEITNSDPALIIFMVKWFERMFGVSTKQLRARLNIHSQQDEVSIKNFWSIFTGIPLENFGKSFIKPKNKRYRKNILYNGTIKVTVPKGTNMRYRTFGWVQGALQEHVPQIESTQRKWGFNEIGAHSSVNL